MLQEQQDVIWTASRGNRKVNIAVTQSDLGDKHLGVVAAPLGERRPIDPSLSYQLAALSLSALPHNVIWTAASLTLELEFTSSGSDELPSVEG